MRRVLSAMALVLGLPLSVAACLWDRDTPAEEAAGLPEVVAVLTGRFERNPPLYYEMRLARVSAMLEGQPGNLAAYDDAGVACDRLGRGDEAVGWMERKQRQLLLRDPADPDFREQSYRYHANLGTFLVHRWIRQESDRARIGEVKAARDEIARALAINPDAHFGREKYQLRAIEWIIDPPKVQPGQDLPNLLGWSFDDLYGQQVSPQAADAAVRGLSGLVVLGNAWESVDVFHALNVALQRDSSGFVRGPIGGRNTLAYLAWLRCRELVDAGKGSMLPDAPKGEALKAMLRRPEPLIDAEKLLDPAFAKLRAEADAWQASRTAFMMERLRQGRHPDTDTDWTFWSGNNSPPAPELPRISAPMTRGSSWAPRSRLGLFAILSAPVVLLFVLSRLSAWVRRKYRAGRDVGVVRSRMLQCGGGGDPCRSTTGLASTPGPITTSTRAGRSRSGTG